MQKEFGSAYSSKVRQQYSKACQSYREGRLKEASHDSQALTEEFPRFAEGWYLNSIVLFSAKQANAALESIERALLLTPPKPAYLIHKVYCLLDLDQDSKAEALVNEFAQECTDSAALLDSLGNIYSRCKKPELALASFQKAAELEPNNPHFQFNLGLSQQSLGDLKNAEATFDRCISLGANNYEVWLHRSRLKKQSNQGNHISDLKGALIQDTLHWRDRTMLQYAIAKEYEDTADYSQSFRHLKHGADLRRLNLQYHVEKDIGAIDNIIVQFSSRLLNASCAGYESTEPIFIVGLPRTGTTLVERIIGAHSCVYAAGELNNFADQLTAQVSENNKCTTIGRNNFIASARSVDFLRLGKDYIDSTRPRTGHTVHFVDKLPLNFLYCGLIAKALPKAKILHITRHPMDACYAIYKTLFTSAYPFSYDLQELGRYYLAYRKLMRHWQTSMPGRVFDVSYEALVSSQESVSRNIFEYCNLEWEPECLDFHENRAVSLTASLSQVRRPIYSTSVGIWKNYMRQLQPLRDILAVGGVL